MNIQIINATTSDIDTLIKWRMRAMQEVFYGEKGLKDTSILSNNAEYYRKHLADGSHTACLAIDKSSDQIVGCGGICYHDEMPSPDNISGKNGYLMNIFALPEFRNQGIGRRIVEHLITDAKDRGVDKIYLESSKMAKKLYSEIGFSDMIDYMKL